ncbi:hypothetical protein [Pseudomonas mosselii]|uniref:hypothetical protein n=3 Tax=Pseudomonas mosselii TaxID=78327 RepID=UPI0021DB58A2|nr:hypothetical protein [Pseudomonas mosselii]MCU9527546.1 hypothetical protein [Pseudomonas mosselii]MCU9534859.1 hypothetical protein [Pseudomonas mosselii]MCU9546699.1 hypothetical protein [Pseudomonas mosselii]
MSKNELVPGSKSDPNLLPDLEATVQSLEEAYAGDSSLNFMNDAAVLLRNFQGSELQSIRAGLSPGYGQCQLDVLWKEGRSWVGTTINQEQYTALLGIIQPAVDGVSVAGYSGKSNLASQAALVDDGRLPPPERQAVWQMIDNALAGMLDPMLRGDVCNILAPLLVPMPTRPAPASSKAALRPTAPNAANVQSLAAGDELTPATWADFVQRLRHDCIGEGVQDHYTADAMFTVQARRLVSGIDKDFTQDLVLICEDREWFSPEDYWDGLGEAEREELDRSMLESVGKKFLEAADSERWQVLGDLPDHTVVGYQETWEFVNTHFTKDAAEAFIQRRKSDYRKGLRVAVESQYWAWEFNAIKNAILTGRLQLVDSLSQATGLPA